MKTCKTCGLDKPLSEFYKHAAMADGYLNSCKECRKAYAISHRNNNLDRIREYDRERGKNRERIAASSAISRLWRAQDSRRTKCHNAVARAVRIGRLIRQQCERCGNANTLAHHDDYDKPLQVRWVCQPCHKQIHKEMSKVF